MEARARRELEILPEGYTELFDSAMEVWRADDRVRAVWLGGAFGRGAGDRAADLDFIVAVRDEDHGSFAAAWHEWLATITPTLLARPIPPPGSFYSLTPGCLRMDVVVERVSDLPATTFRRRMAVLDRDGLDALVPAPADRGPSREAIASLIEEFLRQAVNFPTVVHRDDPLLGVVAITGQHQMLYRLYVEANRPMPDMGLKQWSVKLTPAQRRVLEDLPLPVCEREAVRSAWRSSVSTFIREARPIAARHGVEWPEALEQGLRDWLQRELGMDLCAQAED